MSYLQQKKSNTEDLLNRTLSLIKVYVEKSQKLSEDYINLQKAYSNHLRSNVSGSENCPIELENAEVNHVIVAVRAEERDATDFMFENLMGDEPIEKLLCLWNFHNKEVSSEGTSSKFSHQPKYKLCSKMVMAQMVQTKQTHSRSSSKTVTNSNHFKCDICKRVFNHKGNLNVHIRVVLNHLNAQFISQKFA